MATLTFSGCGIRILPAQRLLEPMMRVRVVVVTADLPVTRGPIELQSLLERFVGIEADGAQPAASRDALELVEEPAPDAESSYARRDPHALDLGDPRLESSDGAAPHRLAEEPGDEQRAAGWHEVADVVGCVEAPVVAAAKSRGELFEVLIEAAPRVGTRRGAWGDLDARGPQQPLDFGHRGDELPRLVAGERSEHGLREGIRQGVYAVQLGFAGARQA